MALTYLSLVNKSLKRLNEVQLTSSNFATTTENFQAFIKDATNDAINDINKAERFWPYNFASGTQTVTPGTQTYDLPTGNVTVDWNSFYITTPDIVANGSFTSAITSWTSISTGTGTAAYTATGNGRLRLAGGASGVGAATQALTTITGKSYRVQVRTFGGTITANVGTTSGGSEISATTLTYTEVDGGQFFEFAFSATGATTYITFTHAANANYDVDYVSVFENISPRHLSYLEFDDWRQNYKASELRMTATSYTMPQRVFSTNNAKFGLSTIPDKAYQVQYDYWSVPTALSLYTDTTTVPDKYEQVILDGILMYAYQFRDNIEFYRDQKTKFKDGIGIMRADLVSRNMRMRSGP